MKVSMIALAIALALSSTYAKAQGGNSLDEMAASSATRSAMNSMHSKHHHHHRWSASRYNGHGINSLGTTTNQGRKYNGGQGLRSKPNRAPG
ncbi:MAG: hypothetical protein P4M05_16090 [Bradyrhizobium sp.]|nr:hypothetical protein [Bradyrhizobium sp.]